jgi:predicted transcriptional regulator
MNHAIEDRQQLRSDTFSFRINRAERTMLATLARKLQRSRSDVVRLLIREALRELNQWNHAAGSNGLAFRVDEAEDARD